MPRRRLTSLLVASGAGLLAAAACTSAPRIDKPRGAPRTSRSTEVLTADGSDRYEVEGEASRLRATAPTANSGINLRVVSVASDVGVSVDQESCATWTGPMIGTVQPGVALRVRSSGSRTVALTVTDNIYLGARQRFNFHQADSSRPTPGQMQDFGYFFPIGFAAQAESLPALPWRMCARVQGRTLEAKVWSLGAGQPEPSYRDPAFAGSTRVPAALVAPGRPGLYVGHLKPGTTTRLIDASSRSLD